MSDEILKCDAHVSWYVNPSFIVPHNFFNFIFYYFFMILNHSTSYVSLFGVFFNFLRVIIARRTVDPLYLTTQCVSVLCDN